MITIPKIKIMIQDTDKLENSGEDVYSVYDVTKCTDEGIILSNIEGESVEFTLDEFTHMLKTDVH